MEAKQMNGLKATQKNDALEAVYNLFTERGYTVEDGNKYGKKGAIIVHFDKCDVQLKAITPANKIGLRYQEEETEE